MDDSLVSGGTTPAVINSACLSAGAVFMRKTRKQKAGCKTYAEMLTKHSISACQTALKVQITDVFLSSRTRIDKKCKTLCAKGKKAKKPTADDIAIARAPKFGCVFPAVSSKGHDHCKTC